MTDGDLDSLARYLLNDRVPISDGAWKICEAKSDMRVYASRAMAWSVAQSSTGPSMDGKTKDRAQSDWRDIGMREFVDAIDRVAERFIKMAANDAPAWQFKSDAEVIQMRIEKVRKFLPLQVKGDAS